MRVQKPGCPQATAVGGEQEARASEALMQGNTADTWEPDVQKHPNTNTQGLITKATAEPERSGHGGRHQEAKETRGDQGGGEKKCQYGAKREEKNTDGIIAQEEKKTEEEFMKMCFPVSGFSE